MRRSPPPLIKRGTVMVEWGYSEEEEGAGRRRGGCPPPPLIKRGTLRVRW